MKTVLKTTYRIIIPLLAAGLVFIACDKECISREGNETVSNMAGAIRLIEVSFANAQVKSELDGFQPKFAAGDVIKVSNGNSTEDCTVSVNDDIASITTTLRGTLTAVYPAAAAKMSGNAISGVKVSSEQDGTFASANICKATIEDGSTSAPFLNQTALFKVTPPSGVKQFTITSLIQIGNDGRRTGNPIAINTEGADAAAKLVITVGNGIDNPGTYYVSLIAGVKLSDLSFEYTTDETHGAIKGIPKGNIRERPDLTETSILYSIDADQWHPYVRIGSVKWATMNLNAEILEEGGEYVHEEFGEYVQWGGAEYSRHYSYSPARYPKILAKTDKTGFLGYVDEYESLEWEGGYDGFDWYECPFNDYEHSYSPDYFESIIGTVTDGVPGSETLRLQYDIVNFRWGGAWETPTSSTFASLMEISNKEWDNENKGLWIGQAPNAVFLSATGYGEEGDLKEADVSGHYWTSSLGPVGQRDCAAEAIISESGISMGYITREKGLCTRPVAY